MAEKPGRPGPVRPAQPIIRRAAGRTRPAPQPAPAALKPKRRFFRRSAQAAETTAPVPQPVRPAKLSGRRSDLTVAALGVTLGLTCALFPWYIFFNQDKFGLREGQLAIPTVGPADIAMSGKPRVLHDGTLGDETALPVEKLDLFATGTAAERDEEEPEVLPPAEQPFPAAPPRFRVVHVENGRAMIEDDGGLFVVGRGDLLPDNSRVAAIETREGRPVVVTSTDEVLEVEP